MKKINIFSFTILICLKLLFLSLIAWHCKNNTTIHEPENVYVKNLNSKISYDSLSIKIDSLFLNTYQIFYIYQNQKNLYFYGYNPKRHQINILGLQTNIPPGIIKLEKEGPNGLGRISNLFVQSNDSIFVFDDNTFALIDKNGTVLKKWVVNDKSINRNKFFTNYRFYSWHNNELFYDVYNQKIYISCLEYMNGIYSKNPKNFFKGSVYASLNLQNDSVEYLPVKYPEEYQNFFYGQLIQPNISFYTKGTKLSSIIMTFPGLSNIYEIDVNDFKTSIYGAKSNITKSSAIPLSWNDAKVEDKKFKHYIENVNFFNIICDASTNYYFRFHYGELPESTIDYSNPYSKKKLVLTILNKRFEIIKEMEFPYRKTYFHSAFTKDNILYIPLLGSSEDMFKLLKVTITHS